MSYYKTKTKYFNTHRESYTSNNQSECKAVLRNNQSQNQNDQYQSGSSSMSYREKQRDSSKSKSLRKLALMKNKEQLCVECSSNRSSSREKILENKIEFMLKEQQHKIIQLGCNGNKIKFNCPAPEKINKKESSHKKKSSTFLSDFLCQDVQNKQNSYHPNRQSKFYPNDTVKSNKLTLRHYINSTPQNSRVRQEKQQQNQNLQIVEDITEREDWLDSKFSKNTQKQNNDKVLKEVLELKGIFMELLNSREQIKTRRKTSNFVKEWSQKSKQAFSLP